MNPELQSALNDFLQRLLDVANSGVDQMPAVLTDVVGSAILAAQVQWWAGLALMLASALLFIYGMVIDRYEGEIPALFGGIGVLMGGIVFGTAWYSYYYAVTFPRLVVLDYLKGLL